MYILFRKWVQIISKESVHSFQKVSSDNVHTFQKVSPRWNSTFIRVYQITTYVNFYIWLKHSLHLSTLSVFHNKNLKNGSKISILYVALIKWNSQLEFWTEVLFVWKYTVPENRQKMLKRLIITKKYLVDFLKLFYIN